MFYFYVSSSYHTVTLPPKLQQGVICKWNINITKITIWWHKWKKHTQVHDAKSFYRSNYQLMSHILYIYIYILYNASIENEKMLYKWNGSWLKVHYIIFCIKQSLALYLPTLPPWRSPPPITKQSSKLISLVVTWPFSLILLS